MLEWLREDDRESAQASGILGAVACAYAAAVLVKTEVDNAVGTLNSPGSAIDGQQARG